MISPPLFVKTTSTLSVTIVNVSSFKVTDDCSSSFSADSAISKVLFSLSNSVFSKSSSSGCSETVSGTSETLFFPINIGINKYDAITTTVERTIAQIKFLSN